MYRSNIDFLNILKFYQRYGIHYLWVLLQVAMRVLGVKVFGDESYGGFVDIVDLEISKPLLKIKLH